MKSSHYLKRSISIFIVTSIILFNSCEKNEISDDVSIIIGKVYRITSLLTFTVDSIHEYRCPMDVVCVWAGDVDLFLNIRRDTHQKDTLMRLNDYRSNPMHYAGYLWEVVDITPYPVSDNPTNPEDVRIRMKISRR